MEARKVGKLSHLRPELRKVLLGYASAFGTSNLEGGDPRPPCPPIIRLHAQLSNRTSPIIRLQATPSPVPRLYVSTPNQPPSPDYTSRRPIIPLPPTIRLHAPPSPCPPIIHLHAPLSLTTFLVTMQVLVTTAAGDFFSLDVSSDIEVENVVALVSLESGVSGDLIQVKKSVGEGLGAIAVQVSYLLY